jgi:hypothetical protein
LTQRALTQSARAFENLIKCTFDPDDENAEDEYELPLPGAPDSPDIGLEDGYLRLSKFDAKRLDLIDLEPILRVSLNLFFNR